MGLPCVSLSHVLALGAVCLVVWVVFLFVLGWDKRGWYGGWDGIGWGSMLGFCVCEHVSDKFDLAKEN
jgi:hypothetical protein